MADPVPNVTPARNPSPPWTVAVHFGAIVLIVATTSLGAQPHTSRAVPAPSPTPSPQAAVISVTYISPDHAASVLRGVFPKAKFSVDHAANAVIVIASADDLQSIRSLIQALDVQNPTKQQVEAIQLHVADPKAVAATLHPLFPKLGLLPARTRPSS